MAFQIDTVSSFRAGARLRCQKRGVAATQAVERQRAPPAPRSSHTIQRSTKSIDRKPAARGAGLQPCVPAACFSRPRLNADVRSEAPKSTRHQTCTFDLSPYRKWGAALTPSLGAPSVMRTTPRDGGRLLNGALVPRVGPVHPRGRTRPACTPREDHLAVPKLPYHARGAPSRRPYRMCPTGAPGTTRLPDDERLTRPSCSAPRPVSGTGVVASPRAYATSVEMELEPLARAAQVPKSAA